MKNLLYVLVFVAMLSPVATFAASCTPAVTHEEFRYQEQRDLDPTNGSESWDNVGVPTNWTTDSQVNGYDIDEKFTVRERIIPFLPKIDVTHRWHLKDTRTVEESPEVCTDEGSDSDSPQSTISGGGGYTYCDLHNGYAVGPQHNCLTRDGKVVQTLAWRGTPVAVGGEANTEQIKVLLNQVVSLLLQQIQYLKTH